ncbi:hypothetical protein U1Q18_050594 [Sarracenia purpurea var. burkii]
MANDARTRYIGTRKRRRAPAYLRYSRLAPAHPYLAPIHLHPRLRIRTKRSIRLSPSTVTRTRTIPEFFYPPQQYVYPGAVGPSPVVYVPRYPAPAESGNEQGSSSGGQPGWGSYFPSNWQSWGSNWGSYFPLGLVPTVGKCRRSHSWNTCQTAASASSDINRAKPEKLEAAEATPTSLSQDSAKLQDVADKNAVSVQLPEQQYVLLGQPQFFGHFAAFPPTEIRPR